MGRKISWETLGSEAGLIRQMQVRCGGRRKNNSDRKMIKNKRIIIFWYVAFVMYTTCQ